MESAALNAGFRQKCVTNRHFDLITFKGVEVYAHDKNITLFLQFVIIEEV